MKYIQLCTTTTYEIGHSIIKAEDYAKRAKDLGYESIAVSDNKPHGTVFTFTLPKGEVELHE